MGKLISIGKILNFHGIKGEVKVGYSAGKEALLKSLKKVFIFQDNVKIAYDVQSVRFHKNFAIIKFKQINSINDVMAVKGLLIHVEESTLKSGLEADEFLISDLSGLQVFDTNNDKVGTVSGVGENKATNLLEIEKTNGIKFMIPFVKEWVPVVDIENGRIVVNMLDGIESLFTAQDNQQ